MHLLSFILSREVKQLLPKLLELEKAMFCEKIDCKTKQVSLLCSYTYLVNESSLYIEDKTFAVFLF